MSRVKQILKKYPILIGAGAILLLAAMIVSYWYWQRENRVVSSVVPEELAREQTIEKITDPRDVGRYIVSAVKQGDLDKFLRGCPIDEKALGMDSVRLTEQEGLFSNENIPAPCTMYGEYFPVTSVEITGGYVELYTRLEEAFKELENPEIIDVSYVDPQRQLGKEYQLEASEICGLWNGKALCDILILLESGGECYAIDLTLISYYDFWKLYSVQSEILESGEESVLFSIAEAEYAELKSSEKQQNKLHNYLSETVRGEISDEEEKQELKEQKEVQKIIDKGEGLLSPNYVVLNTSYGKTAENTIAQFTTSLQKKDWTAAMSFLDLSEEPRNPEHVSVDVLLKQADIARKIKSFYYGILWEGKSQEGKTFEELGKTGEEILWELTPEYSFYIDLNKVVEDEKAKCYKAYFYYMGERYEVKFEMAEYEEGWMIKDINENIRKLSKKEVKEILG